MRTRRIQVHLIALLLCVPALASAKLPVGLLSSDRIGLCHDTTDADAALDCWLNQHPDVAGAMNYTDSAFNGTWPSWPQPVKDQMHHDFDQMVVWYYGGAGTPFPHQFPIPIPPGGAPQADGPGSQESFWMTEDMGKSVYLSEVANNLAAELTAAFPWTITTYTPQQLAMVVGMNDSMYFSTTAATPGYFFQFGGPSPATAAFEVRFFKSQQILGSDAADTIERLWAWERNFSHFYYVAGDPTVNVYPYFWGPNTPPIPDSKVIRGTRYKHMTSNPLRHYTAGCSGTQDFMKSVLRSVNIPVERRWASACGHATPAFPTVNLLMTHGDDPYDGLGVVSPFGGFSTPAPSEYFVALDSYDQLFPAGQSLTECLASVGVQVANVAIQYGSDELMTLYCQDLASGADHASGQVYANLKKFYPLQTLESMGLWTTLDFKVTTTGFCGQ